MKKRWLILLIISSTGLGLLATSSIASANFSSLSISPVRNDIVIKPGQSKKVQITLTNPGKEQLTLIPVQNDFVANDENGTPDIILDPNNSAPAHGLKSFFEPMDKVTIEPKSSKVVEVPITVPDRTQAGGYFGAIRFIPDREGTSGQVNLNASLASLILLLVPGDIVEQLQLTDFNVHLQGQKLGSMVYLGDKPIDVTARFENKGNVQLSPFGQLSLKRWNKVVYETSFNDKTPADMILPGGARKWDIPLSQTSQFGRYKVQATFAYGEGNKTINIEKTFWVVPVQAMIWAGIGLGVFIFLIMLLSGIHRFRHRRRKVKLGSKRKR